jgi:outer membrane protein with beta-barrel domain
MTKSCVLLVLLRLLSAFSVAQEAQEFTRVEAFGGYSYLGFQPGGATGINLNGWNGAMQYNVNRSIGLKADASGHYGTPVAGETLNSYSFLFGPVISNRVESSPGFTPFLHGLVGVNRISASGNGLSASDSAFAMAFGGGVDVKAARRVYARLVQIDYLFTKHGTAMHQDNIRVSAGVVFQLGGQK